MRYTALLLIPALSSCQAVESLRDVVADPQVQDQLIAAGLQAGQQGLSGNLVGAGWTLGGVATLVLGKWVKDRMKNSAPGEILGGSKPA